MLFDPSYASSPRGTPRSPAVLRILSAGAMLAYVAGAFTLALGPGETLDWAAGSLLILLSLGLAGLVTSSSIARLAGDYGEELDEYERRLNSDALSSSYRRLGFLLLLAAAYAYVAPDLGWWLPAAEQWGGVLFFFVLCFWLLPTLTLLSRWPGEARNAAAADEEVA